MHPVLLAPPIPGIMLSNAALETFKGKLRVAYPAVVGPKTGLHFPNGWAWLVADLIHALNNEVGDVERESALPLQTVELKFFDSALSVSLPGYGPTIEIAAEQARTKSRSICQVCGSKQGAVYRAKLHSVVYCVLCREIINPQLKRV